MGSLKTGQWLRCTDSRALCRVDSFIGDGGQGEVYQATLNGRPFALKWYHDPVLRIDRGLRQRLQLAVDRGAPSPQFLWPFELVTLPEGGRLGYLMPLRSPSFVKIQAVLAQQVRPSFRVLAMLCWQLTEGLLALHAKGLVYQDLNAGNVFFDPQTGAVEICDNDNVDVDGAPSVMGGVWEFQAPEVVLRQAGPSRATDLHSLAVMLFKVLHIGHPLVGARELAFANLSEPAVLRRLYGSEARFVFDPQDDSNRPLLERHGPVLGHWAIYPQALRDLFIRAFTDGLFDPQHGRVQETEWRQALRQLHDAVQTCRCGAENFYDPRRLASGRLEHTCWHCGSAMPATPPRIGLWRPGARRGEAPLHVVVAEPGAVLFGHHLGCAEPAQPVGRIGLAGLRNDSPLTWQVQGADEVASRSLPPGETVALAAGLQLQCGAVRAQVKT